MTAAQESRPIADLDVSLPVLTLLIARLHTESPSDQIAYAHDVRLIEQDAPVSTDADYPEWPAQLAALIAKNKQPKGEA